MPPEGTRIIAQRFGVGAEIHGEYNWMESCNTPEDAFKFARGCYNHMIEHAIRMGSGDHDNDAGGNLGAIGWAVYALAYIEAKYECHWTELVDAVPE